MDQFHVNKNIPILQTNDSPAGSGLAVKINVNGIASEMVPNFELERQTTILLRGDNDLPLTRAHQSRWEPKSDTSETNETVPGDGSSDISIEFSSTPTSPLLAGVDASPYLTPSGDWAQRLPSLDNATQLSIEDSAEERDSDVPTSRGLGIQKTEDSIDAAQLDSIRGHGVTGLEVPKRVLRYESSVITDGGDQQFKSQRLESTADNASNREPDLSQTSTTVRDPAATFSLGPGDLDYVDSQFFLSSQIIDAMGQNRNPAQLRHERGFLPKAQMDNIVTPTTVLEELFSNHIAMAAHTIDQVKKCAEDVCRETEICLPNRKTKIRSFRKIFAILVLTEKPWAIFKFIEEDVSDIDLPLVMENHRVRRGLRELRRRDAWGNPSPKPLQCSRGWPPTSVMNFEMYQWRMLAPFFSPGKYGDVKHYVLHDQHILPFIGAQQDEDDECAELGGGFGRVFMVHIHDEHHNFRHPKVRACGFAIKELYESNRTMFNREVSILKRFSGIGAHPHIVSLLATYEQFQKFHLVFYRAEGDLFKYWKRINPRPTFDYENIRWMAKQCKGIATALLCLHKHYTLERCDTIRQQEHEKEEDELEEPPSKTEGTRFIIPRTHGKRKSTRPSSVTRHIRSPSPTWPAGFPRTSSDPQQLPRQSTDEQPSQPLRHKRSKGDPYIQWGRHGDLKPENILFFSEPNTDNLKGTLKISDFGQAQLNSKSRKSNLQAGEVAHSLAYRAPECDLQPRKISQSHDIWSLGCVFLEFIAWMLGGARLLREFSKKRLSWDIFMNTDIDTFFEIVKNKDTQEAEIMVKPAVTKFICELHSHHNCTDYFHDFLDMIEHNMLLIEPMNGEKTRISISKVKEILTIAYKICCHDTDYAIKKNPWTSKAMNAEPLMRSVKLEMTGDVEEVIKKNKSFLRAHQGPPET